MATKLRVLCLHGYTQSAQKFRDRTGPLRRLLRADLELIYIDAPQPSTDGSGGLAWWNNNNHEEKQIQESIDCVRRVLNDQGPFEGILGFSQGAGMASIVMAVLRPSQIKFAVL
ncbi:hypothetical protein GGH95_005127, partial [Coemansia sp. RSA 1836]